jgi:hypothetical protein
MMETEKIFEMLAFNSVLTTLITREDFSKFIFRESFKPYIMCFHLILLKKKLRGFSPQANYTDRATAACRQS